MAIKVSFLTGANTATVSGLYQWDYGQILEIECSELGSEIVEVHFACANMSEAIVRTCAFTNGIGTVTIPDECLEQTNAVTAWVYKVDSTQGHTVKAITLPITARTRPSNTRSVPADYNDKYGQLIEEVNEAIDAIENGNVTAAKALSAVGADHANTATSAANATYATAAGSANHATSADNATSAENATNANNANIASSLTVKETYIGYVSQTGIALSLTAGKVYLISANIVGQSENIRDTFLLYISSEGAGKQVYSTVSRYGFFVRAINNSVWELWFCDPNETEREALQVTIRAI